MNPSTAPFSSEFRPWTLPPGRYAGVGSRQTPPDVLALMTVIARRLAARGFVLRSGGAVGADRAFEKGAPHREIYLPWTDYSPLAARLYTPTTEAFVLASKHHRAWSRLGGAAKALHARNAHIVLGTYLKTPALFVVCWTRDGAIEKTTAETGGTGQAIRIAVAHGIKVWNLARGDHRAVWEAIT